MCVSALPQDRKQPCWWAKNNDSQLGLIFMSQTVAYIWAFQGSSVFRLLHILKWLALMDKYQERQQFKFRICFGIPDTGRGGDSGADYFGRMWVGTFSSTFFSFRKTSMEEKSAFRNILGIYHFLDEAFDCPSAWALQPSSKTHNHNWELTSSDWGGKRI